MKLDSQGLSHFLTPLHRRPVAASLLPQARRPAPDGGRWPQSRCLPGGGACLRASTQTVGIVVSSHEQGGITLSRAQGKRAARVAALTLAEEYPEKEPQ